MADTVASIRRAAGSGSSSVHGYTADLSDLAAVRQLAAVVAAEHPRLHALVNNAGVYETQKRWGGATGGLLKQQELYGPACSGVRGG